MELGARHTVYICRGGGVRAQAFCAKKNGALADDLQTDRRLQTINASPIQRHPLASGPQGSCPRASARVATDSLARIAGVELVVLGHLVAAHRLGVDGLEHGGQPLHRHQI